MSAILEPDPKRNANKTLKLTKLDPPNPLNPPPGCRFSDRCPFRMDKCVTKEPELKQVNAGHYVACYLY
jgi:oligopeptide/dipeptide ABC transporter ATP-binding protein